MFSEITILRFSFQIIFLENTNSVLPTIFPQIQMTLTWLPFHNALETWLFSGVLKLKFWVSLLLGSDCCLLGFAHVHRFVGFGFGLLLFIIMHIV